MPILNHLLIIPDGGRRYTRRELLTDLFRQSVEEFERSVLQNFPKKYFPALKRRIEKYAQMGKDPFYREGFEDLLDLSKINIPLDFLLNSYRRGGKVFDSIVRWILKNNATKILSIYAIQRRNLDRSDEQTYAVLKSELEVFKLWANDEIITSQCSFKFVGDQGLFKRHKDRDLVGGVIKEFVNSARELEERFSGKKLKIYILAPYDREWEINQAVINGKFAPARLVVKEEVNLILRTGYAKTPTSGALPYQTAYAQFSPVPEYFPDFTIEIFQKVLEEYGAKERESGL